MEWAAGLPGSDGSVGMYGLSYFGKTQWHAAVMRPPSLRSMAPGADLGQPSERRPDARRRPGARPHAVLGPGRPSPAPPLPQIRRRSGEDRARSSSKPDRHHRRAAGRRRLRRRCRSQASPTRTNWLPSSRAASGRGVDDEAWDYLNIDGKYDGVDVPTFHIGGWYDCFIGETLQTVRGDEEALRRERGCARHACWSDPGRTGTSRARSGDLDFGIGSSEWLPRLRTGDLTDAHLRWFDATLKGEEERSRGHAPRTVCSSWGRTAGAATRSGRPRGRAKRSGS